MSSHLFCFGLGYSALVLARRLRDRGWRVSGTTRRAEKAEKLAQAGFEAFLFDQRRMPPELEEALSQASHVLVSAAPDEAGDPVLDVAGDVLAAQENLAWLGYLSTTGVYGDHGGAWVDEESQLKPSAARSRRRVAAERAWIDLQRLHGVPLQIFRLAGIYGPGRSVLDRLRDGTAQRIDKPGHLFGRIHVADIANVLEASMARPDSGAIYNVCDDLPASPADVVAYGAELLGLEPPPLVPFEAAELSPMARSFYADNRKVRNERIKRDLGGDAAVSGLQGGAAVAALGDAPSHEFDTSDSHRIVILEFAAGKYPGYISRAVRWIPGSGCARPRMTPQEHLRILEQLVSYKESTTDVRPVPTIRLPPSFCVRLAFVQPMGRSRAGGGRRV